MAETHLYSEIRNKGYKKGAYEFLAVLYAYEGRDSAMRSIVYSGAADYIAPEFRTRVYFEDHDFARFFALKFHTLLGGITSWGLSGGIGILLVWMYVLVSFGRVSELRLRHLLFPVIAGAAVCLPAWWLYAYYRYGLGFTLDGSVVNDFIFSVTGIGFIEELVKLIPFLCVLFTRIIQKPIDYIIVASACGLGFAVFENLMYITDYGLEEIHSRALTSSVAHMALCGIASYGFILRRYRRKNQYWLIPAFFLLAVAAHGFYDFWLVNETVKAYAIVTLLFYLTLIVTYYSFISNALNQSVSETETERMARFDPLRITSVFAGSMILLFTFEYVATSAVFGTHYGNTSMQKAFLAGGYLVFFLSIRLSRIRIEPHRWNKIDFLSGILPSRILGDKNEAEEITEEATSSSSPDEQTLPPGSR
jgi:RsiW-degrading membrane proteinase PrsW (M82 family)